MSKNDSGSDFWFIAFLVVMFFFIGGAGGIDISDDPDVTSFKLWLDKFSDWLLTSRIPKTVAVLTFIVWLPYFLGSRK